MADIALRVVGTVAGAAYGWITGGPPGALIWGARGYAAGAIASGLLVKKQLPAAVAQSLQDLRLQVASYGVPVGIVYGTARKAGNVIDGQDIQKHSDTTTQSQSKGGGQEQEVTNFYYTCTFAVLVCEGPALGIRRVWANGKLLYDKGVDTLPDVFLASRHMHVMLGDEDQEPSSILEGLHGAGNVPAYRGSVVCVFDTFPLGEFGNRLPNFEFEVVRSGDLVTLVPQDWVTLPESESFYDSGLGDPYRVALAVPDSSRVWMILDSGGNPRKLALFNSFSQAYDYTQTFDGDIYLQGVNSDGSAWVAQEGGTAEGLHRVNTVGGDTYYPGSDDFSRFTELAETGGELVLRVNQAIGGHQIYTVDVEADPLTKTNVNTGKFLNYFFAKPGAYSGRVYIAGFDDNAVTPSAARIGYIDNGGVWNTLVDYNHVGSAAYGIVGQSYLFIRSGNTGEGDVIEKRTHAGVLVDSVALSGMTATEYGVATELSLNADESFLYVKAGVRIWKIATGTMEEELVNLTAGSANEHFVQGSAFQGTGTMVTQIGTDDTVIKIVPPDELLDATSPTLADVVEEIILHSPLTAGDLDLTALESTTVLGYVLSQPMSIRDAIEQLRPVFFFDLIESDYQIKGVVRTGTSLATIPERHLGARAPGEGIVDPIRITRAQETDLPRRLHLNYLSLGSDYQAGTQSSKRIATSSEQEVTIGVPIVLTDAQAAQVVETGMYEAWSLRETLEIQVSRRYALYEPGDWLTLESGDTSVVSRWLEKLEGANGLIKVRAVPAFAEAYTQIAPGASTGNGQTIVPLAPTEAIPLDIHLLREVDNYPGAYWSAAGLSTEWQGTKLYKSFDDGTSYEAVPNGLIAAAASIGSLTEDLAGPPNDAYEVFDTVNVVTARMRPGVEPASYTRAQVLAGTAIPLLIKRSDEPGEILFYMDATNTSGQIWEFTGLLRARGGTETFVEHDAGELVVLLDSALLSVMESSSELNIERLWKAPSVGSTLPQASPIAFTNTGARLKPLAGRELGGGFDGSGDLLVEWTPSTRIPDVLRDYADAPVGEAFERYRIYVLDGYEGDVVEFYEVTTNAWTYSAADQADDFGSARDGYYLRIVQLSDIVGEGYPLSGWAPAPAAGAYAFWRLHAMTTPNGTKVQVSEIQLIGADGSTIVSEDVPPTTNLSFNDGAGLTAANMVDNDLTTGSETTATDPGTFATCHLQWELDYPAALAGFKQGGSPAALGGLTYYLTDCTLSGSEDGDTFATVETFSGLTFPGLGTLSSLYPIT
jgi:hypothetical protein